jgi:DNA-binding transcriptional MerR regulator
MRKIVDVRTGKVTEDAAWRPEPLPPPPPPAAITRRQLRLWLVRNGFTLAQVEALIDALPEPQRTEARIEWQDATQYERGHPLLQQLSGALLKLRGVTLDAALDKAFREAAAM